MTQTPTIARLIGGAGTGKTTELMRCMEQVIARGVDPLSIGFVSFTRAARREASSRAAAITGGSASQLEGDGWFRTLHSVCYRCLGQRSASMLSGDAESRRWIEAALQDNIGRGLGDECEDGVSEFEQSTDAGIALQLWSAARNRLEPLLAAWERAYEVNDRTPDYNDVAAIVERYESAKRLDGRSDFTDLLGRFSGVCFGVDGHGDCTPEGAGPALPVWFFDEQQDTSALLDRVCRRLIDGATWVYVVGDPFQSIYGFAGADASKFLAWKVAKQKIMPRSFRCPPPVHELGEQILAEASDYWDRGIQPAEHSGSCSREHFTPDLLTGIDPRDDWLLLARTNWHANRIATKLRLLGIPWCPTRGVGGWNRPKKNEAFNALYCFQTGAPITSREWAGVTELIPSKSDGGELLTRGTKAKWQKPEMRKQFIGFYPDTLHEAGATQLLVDMILSGRWVDLIDGADEYVAARRQYGYDAVHKPSVRVGTIHSAKGAEADNVLWLTSGTKATAKACEQRAGHDEECRVAYVAATRAKRNLTVAIEPNNRNRFDVAA